MIKAKLIPLVVDLDGTLTPTDTLVESLITVVKQSPLHLWRLPFWLMKGRDGLKDAIAARASLATEHLPYCEPLIDYLRQEKAKGRQIVLATAAHHSIAAGVAKHLGLFDQVLATETGHNLKGKVKLQAIKEKVGASFVYAGDSQADLPIWKAAQAAVLVNVSKHTATTVRQSVPIEREFSSDNDGISLWLRALRVHQWLKNLLLFVPLLTAFSFMDINKLAAMALAFLAFSLVASATYIVNDVWDIDSDRAHPRKRFRPFASAKLPILHGLAVAGGALILAFVLACALPTSFFLILLLYLVLTSAYSWGLKQYVLMDVLILSMLYNLRILAGSAAIGITTSSWLLAFSTLIFLSLALVKRCTELVWLGENGAKVTPGRNYRVTDLIALWPLGIGTALFAVVVFGLFINEAQGRYGTPELLWLVAIALFYWLSRIWVITYRGEMHDDPVVYAIQDKGSLVTLFMMVTITLAAHFLTLDLSL